MKPLNPSQVSLVLGGIPVQRGFADGEFFNADPMSDGVLSVVGTDGEVAVSVSYDTRWQCTIRLLETSDENKKLSALYNLKLAGNGPVGFFPFLYKDVDTGEVLTGTDACVMRAPTISKDRSAIVREWKILVANGRYSRI